MYLREWDLAKKVKMVGFGSCKGGVDGGGGARDGWHVVEAV